MFIKYFSNGKELCFRHATLRALQGQDITTEIEEDEYYSFCNCSDCVISGRDLEAEIAMLQHTVTGLNNKLADSERELEVRDSLINKLANPTKPDPEDAQMEEEYLEKLERRRKIPPRKTTKDDNVKKATTELIKYLFSITNPQPYKPQPIVYDESYKAYEKQVEEKIKSILGAIEEGHK
jgi:hypothetical protein